MIRSKFIRDFMERNKRESRKRIRRRMVADGFEWGTLLLGLDKIMDFEL